MNLVLNCHPHNHKVYLSIRANTRNELARMWGYGFRLRCPHCECVSEYHVNEVYAEMEKNTTLPGAVIGGLIGLIGGPIGAVSGSTIGGFVGHKIDDREREQVRIFNNSFVHN